MSRLLALGLLLSVCCLPVWAEDLKSGLPVGSAPMPFHLLNVVNADDSSLNGKEACLVCQYGAKPVVLVFARCCDCSSTAALAKKLDTAVAKVGKDKMSAALVFMTESPEMAQKLQSFAGKNELKNVSLAVMGPNGPDGYKINDKAGVTVLMYRNRKVIANHAFDSMCETCVEKVVADLTKVMG
ncbi:MAG TPA: hypothetical protein PKD86_05515 [Gemmatales bacterium]|nr:hypothetical protein [Gemmatales bacterium]HMP58791.1 hypothetical protein [Gemmatales bacterium]